MDIIIQHLSGTLEKLDIGGGRYPVKVQKLIQLPKLKMFWCQDNEFLDPDFESIEELAVLKEQMPHLQINGANLGKYLQNGNCWYFSSIIEICCFNTFFSEKSK